YLYHFKNRVFIRKQALRLQVNSYLFEVDVELAHVKSAAFNVFIILKTLFLYASKLWVYK
ncbi:hypothetical protein, partial [Pseudoalteromonas sp. BSi20495]|uniref:hypothetical protein n=1 Tax=Pseudoalteromonas sp. BSi20495 TaxID=386429 RepID=UPI0005181909